MDGPDQHIGLIGGIGLTEVHVYAQRPAPDGLFSGCPHVHAVTDEGYFVLRGSGHVEFHDLVNGYRKLPLAVGHYVHFPPLVMHRLVSDGDLVILGMMANAGLAERGEARIYFGREADEDSEKFEQLQSLPKRLGLEGALQRRDEAVRAYQQFVKLWAGDRRLYFAELKRFVELHCATMANQSKVFLDQVSKGPMMSARTTQRRIEQLPAMPNVRPQIELNRIGDDQALGMCGVLRPIISLETLAAQ
jgi:mannose-6-phosphate isomerase-like protein (cupin superfamily)